MGELSWDNLSSRRLQQCRKTLRNNTGKIDFRLSICDSMPMTKSAHTSKHSAITPLAPPEILKRLAPKYGPLSWHPRYDPVSELVFTVLSQHTSDLNSEKAFHRLHHAFGSWDAVADSDDQTIARCIRTGGLAQVKAPRIKAILNRILELRSCLDLDFLRDLPLSEAKTWLMALPGVGPKTAAVVLCFALGMPAMPVDTHIHRVTKRLGLIDAKTTADQAHDLLEAMVAPEEVFAFHIYLITHGRRTCKAQRPLCQDCVLLDSCPTGRERLGVSGSMPR